MLKNIAIIGASGVVGKEVIHCLDQLNFPTDKDHLMLFSSPRSAGEKVETPFGEMTYTAFDLASAQESDIIFLCVDGDFAKEYAHKLTEKGATVIDQSSAFRYDESVPLVVPEINVESIGDSKLIANPNCTTAILVMALYPLYKKFGLEKVIISTYQATSGGGLAAMNELEAETKNYLAGEKVSCDKFAHPIPFNLIPQIDTFQENGYTKEEMKVTWETQKIFGEPDLRLSCTAVRIPTFRAHAESVTIETTQPITPASAREALSNISGLEVVDDQEKLKYPMPITCTHKFDVEVGRIRQNLVFGKNGLDFFVCGDQLLRGAALNAVKIAEKLV